MGEDTVRSDAPLETRPRPARPPILFDAQGRADFGSLVRHVGATSREAELAREVIRWIKADCARRETVNPIATFPRGTYGNAPSGRPIFYHPRCKGPILSTCPRWGLKRGGLQVSLSPGGLSNFRGHGRRADGRILLRHCDGLGRVLLCDSPSQAWAEMTRHGLEALEGAGAL